MQAARVNGFGELETFERVPEAVPIEPLEATPPEPEYPLVLVEWHDAWFDYDQAGPGDCRPDYLVRTVGFLVGETPRIVSLAQEILPDDDGFRAVTHIPVAIVERIVPLAASS
jgi:hypothetical protein